MTPGRVGGCAGSHWRSSIGKATRSQVWRSLVEVKGVKTGGGFLQSASIFKAEPRISSTPCSLPAAHSSVFFCFHCSTWDLSSLTRDWTCAPCVGRQSLSHSSVLHVMLAAFPGPLPGRLFFSHSLFTGSPAQSLSLQTSKGTPFNVAFMFLPIKGLPGGTTSYSIQTQLLGWSLQIFPLFGPSPDLLSCFPYSLAHTLQSPASQNYLVPSLHLAISMNLLPLSSSFWKYLNIYLFIWVSSWLQHLGSLLSACGIYFPDQGSSLGPCFGSAVLATGPPGKSHSCFLSLTLLKGWLWGPRPWLVWGRHVHSWADVGAVFLSMLFTFKFAFQLGPVSYPEEKLSCL